MASSRTLIVTAAALAAGVLCVRPAAAQTIMDFRLSTSSPGLNTGQNDPVYALFQGTYALSIARDMMGSPRPQGPAFDIGALEVNGADLSVTITDAPDPVAAGASLNYTVMVTNNGPLASLSFTVTVTLPSGATFVTAPPACSHAAGVVTCLGMNLNPSTNIGYVINVLAPPPGSFSAVATVTETSP